MKRERLFRKEIKELKGVTVDYYLTIDEDSACETYGVCLVKSFDNNLIEEFVSVDHVWSKRDEAEHMIKRLANGETTPVTLSAIIDDYLAAQE